MNWVSENKTAIFEMIDNMDNEVRVINSDHKIIYMNKLMRKNFGEAVGQDCYAAIGCDGECVTCISKAALDENKPTSKNIFLGDKYYKMLASPVVTSSGERFSIEMFRDITDQKNLEEELLTKYTQLKKETEVARKIQQSILPEDGTYWDTFRLNSVYLPAEDLGGDLYDIVRINDDQTLLYIADVAGHGVQASLLTVFLRQVVRSHAEDASIKIGGLIETLLEGFNDLDISGEMYFSVLFCLYNKREQELVIANCGHNCYPLIVRENGRVEEIQVKGLPISKLALKFNYPEEKIGLYENERLILYTDGVIEEYSEIKKKPFGSEGIRRIVENHHKMEGKELAQYIIDEAMSFSQKTPTDDRAIMVADVL